MSHAFDSATYDEVVARGNKGNNAYYYDYYDDGFVDDSFWASPTGEIVKWSVMLGLTVIFITYFLGGYLHAKRRMKKGLKPLWYHRWLVSRTERRPMQPDPSQFTYQRQPEAEAGYNGGLPPGPPPVYNQGGPAPSAYPPEKQGPPPGMEQQYGAPQYPPVDGQQYDAPPPPQQAPPEQASGGSGLRDKLKAPELAKMNPLKALKR